MADKPQLIDRKKKSKPKELIVLGGFLVPEDRSIYKWVDENFQGATKLPRQWNKSNTFAGDSANLAKTINNKLESGSDVLVVGHSLGSLLAYDVEKQFKDNPRVDFLFVDPPASDPVMKPLGFLPMVKKAKEYGPELLEDPRSVIWTQGKGVSQYPSHDPFVFRKLGENPRRLEELRRVIERRRLGQDRGMPESLLRREGELSVPISGLQIKDINQQKIILQDITPAEREELKKQNKKFMIPRRRINLPGTDENAVDLLLARRSKISPEVG